MSTHDLSMYVLMCPCILDPSLRARGITTKSDLDFFSRAIERCRRFNIDIVPLPCPETLYLGKGREPAHFLERLNTPGFSSLLDDLEDKVRETLRSRGQPLCIIGVNSSPACGVDTTYYGSEAGEPPKRDGRGAFLARFPEIKAVDVTSFACYRIYLAAPLFSESEKAYNLELHTLLTNHFFDVYLPQEVGDDKHCRDRTAHRMIFDMHVQALQRVDMVVAVVDGADADSGTSWEMGYASAQGKPVFALRTDFRMAGHHERVNLMLEQSATMVTKKEELPMVLGSLLL